MGIASASSGNRSAADARVFSAVRRQSSSACAFVRLRIERDKTCTDRDVLDCGVSVSLSIDRHTATASKQALAALPDQRVLPRIGADASLEQLNRIGLPIQPQFLASSYVSADKQWPAI